MSTVNAPSPSSDGEEPICSVEDCLAVFAEATAHRNAARMALPSENIHQARQRVNNLASGNTSMHALIHLLRGVLPAILRIAGVAQFGRVVDD